MNTMSFHTTSGRLSATQRLSARGLTILGGAVMMAGMLGLAEVENGHTDPFHGSVSVELSPAEVAADLELVKTPSIDRELERARALVEYAARFSVEPDLAALIYDVALDEAIDPELAFRLVYVESRFDTRAISPAGAYGLAQVMPNTARIFEPNLQPEDLFDAEMNLRIGFRFLRDLMNSYPDDISLALLAYNRGPTRLRSLMRRGIDPRNGYASAVLDGYEMQGDSIQ